MSEINDEIIQKARNADLADFFQSSGYDCELRKNELHVKGYGGLFVNTDTNEWYCFSQADKHGGGKNPINCLTDVLGMDFKTAVEQLSDGRLIYEKKQSQNISFSERKHELILPEKADNMKKVFAYLCQTRKIDSKIVSELAKDGLLYQDKRGNAVFVHRNEKGEIIGAEIQGTNSEKRYKGVAQGTRDSVFAVKIGDHPNKCYVFESAIDLMSFKQLANPEKINSSILVSMAGLKPNSLKNIAESGLKMYSCVDNDEAGKKFTESNNLIPCHLILEQHNVKDYNELLQKLTRKISNTEKKDVANNLQASQEFNSNSSRNR